MSDTSETTTYGATAAATALVMVYVLGVSYALQQSYDIAGGVLVAHVLALISVPIIFHLTRHDERKVRRLILAGLGAKFVGTLARYAVIYAVYGGGDASAYHEQGTILARAFRSGDFTALSGTKLVGTRFVEIITGLVYTFTGSTRLGGFMVFSWMGFWGAYLFYRAFRIALPDADHRRYGLFVFFLPSMVFWPSSLGKDAWMTLTIGVVAYGAARLVKRRPMGLPVIMVGVLGTAMVRPHVTIIAVGAIMTAFLLAANRSRSFAAPLYKLVGTVALGAVLIFSAVSAQRFFKIESIDSIAETQVRVQDRTEKGSTFDAPSVTSPAQLPLAIFTVLFRPLPFEAGNPMAFATSLEGAGLLALFVLKAPRLRNLIPRRKAPFVTFAAVYSILFAVAFSNISNFGILARQRVQLFPLVLVALAVPTVRKRRRGPDASAPPPAPPLRAVPDTEAEPLPVF